MDNIMKGSKEMEHEVKLIARTVAYEKGEVPDIDDVNRKFTLFSGKAAGTCYMPDDYFEEGIQNEKAAMSRAANTAKSGHHSVYDHPHLSLQIYTSKMMCMILNSLGVYATSEKSARFTKMHPKTEREQELYEKWIGRIRGYILKEYPDMDDDALNKALKKQFGDRCGKVVNGSLQENDAEQADWLAEYKDTPTLPSFKLAQENARYMISVFTPTAMVYTVSFRQIFLILDYFEGTIDILRRRDRSVFEDKLLTDMVGLHDALGSIVGGRKLHDNKSQKLRFLVRQSSETVYEPKKQSLGDSYTLVYLNSLAMLAQNQRHRTTRCNMELTEAGEFGYYTPEIVEMQGKDVAEEWLNDIQSVSYCIPQGTIVRITEQGVFEDYAMKCRERLCGRAQLETMKRTASNLMLFYENRQNLSEENLEMLMNMIKETSSEGEVHAEVLSRCMFKDFNCQEACRWGGKQALTRRA